MKRLLLGLSAVLAFGVATADEPATAERGRASMLGRTVSAVLFLMQFRDADLNVQKAIRLNLPGPVCEDVPAWWLLKKKTTMYHTGVTDARSVRSLMPFMLSPLNGGAYI